MHNFRTTERNNIRHEEARRCQEEVRAKMEDHERRMQEKLEKIKQREQQLNDE